MSETRKIAAILVSDVVGYSRLAGADEDRTLARLRGLRSDLIDPAIAAHRGRIVKGTGDGLLAEFRSVVDAASCAIEIQNGMVERNVGLPPDRRIEFRIGIHVGDVVEEQDGDLMGESVNIAARLESICKPGAICLSEDAYRQVKARLNLAVNDLGPTQLKNIAEPIRVYALDVGEFPQAKAAPAPAPEKPTAPRLSIVVLPFANIRADPEQEYFVDGVTESLTTDLSRIGGSFVIGRNTAFTYKGKAVDLKQIGRELNVRYVLEGSVQRGGNRMRANVQLIDVESAVICGLSGSKGRLPIFSPCRTRSSRGWRTRFRCSSSPRRRGERSEFPRPIRWTYIFRECRGFTRARAQTPWPRRPRSSRRPWISIPQTSTP